MVKAVLTEAGFTVVLAEIGVTEYALIKGKKRPALTFKRELRYF